MKTNHLKHSGIAALLAGALVTPSSAQTEAFGDILGYYKFNAPAGNSAWVCGLVKKKDHQGAMESFTSVTQSVITENDRNFATNEFSNHYVEIIEPGPWQGLILDIVSNTTNTITVEGNLGGFSGLSSTSSFCIREHVTLGDLLPNGGGLIAGFDQFQLFRTDGSNLSAIYNTTEGSWVDIVNTGSGGSPILVNSEIIYPGQGFIITALTSTEIMVGMNGVTHVKDTPTFVPLLQGIVNLVGIINPIINTDLTLGSIGLPESDLIDGFDQIELFSNNGSLTSLGTFITDGNSVLRVNEDSTTSNADNTAVPVGSAFSISPQLGNINYQQPVLHLP